jgi:hypothetical protein
MATKKVPAIVTPAEWKDRTSLTLSSRGETTLVLDSAYTRWYNARSQPNERIEEMYRQQLRDALLSYYSEHGGSWKKCKRNTESNGLLEFIYNKVKAPDAITEAGRKRMDISNQHSRYGVLYLLANIDINMEYFGIVLEGAGAVGGALASGFGTNYSELKDPDKADITAFSVKGEDVSVSDAFGYSNTVGQAGIKKIHGMVTAPGAVKAGPTTRQIKVMRPTAMGTKGASGAPPLTRGRASGGHAPPPFLRQGASSGQGRGLPHAVGNMNYLKLSAATHTVSTMPAAAQSDYGFPVTKKALKALGERPVTAVLFAPVSGAVVIGALFYDMMAKVINVLVGLVKDLVKWLMDKLQSMGKDPFMEGTETLRPLIMFAVKKCAEAAVPFVSAGLDLVVGLAQTFKGIKMKVGGWLERRKIRITDGHPALLASRIEKCMTMDIAAGLWTLIKGAVQMALAFLAAGAQGLIAAITSAVEWVIKFVMRLMEQASIKLFLLKARVLFLQERIPVDEVVPGDPRVTRAPSELKRTGSLVGNMKKFKEFFQEGCDASPVIAMLTLNTGICGSQWQLQNMFTDLGEIGQKEFDSGTKYFTRLKKYGLKYLNDCGFQFVANPSMGAPPASVDARTQPMKDLVVKQRQAKYANEKKVIQGYLDHACGKGPRGRTA